MAYITQDDIEHRIGLDDLKALADYDGDAAPDADVVAQAIADAQGEVDSYLQVKFAVPVAAPIPAVLQMHCTGMAVYYLQLGRDSVTENYRKAYEDAIKWLKDVVAGKASLGVEPKPAEASGAPGVKHQVDDRLFGRGKELP